MHLDAITPMILTYNEQDNLLRTLNAVRWAKQILIVDSYSTDDTLKIAAEFPQVQVIQRRFDHFADQCNFGLEHIQSEWVLSLDADYVCCEGLQSELETLDGSQTGYAINFKYGIYGKALRSSLYPPRVVLYRRQLAEYRRDGHAHRVAVEGSVGQLGSWILHDDWKPLSHWFRSQLNYAEHEAEKLATSRQEELGWKDKLRRKVVFAPFLTPVYCLLVKRLILDGWPGIYYTMQRTFAELVLSLTLLDRKLSGKNKPLTPGPLSPKQGEGR